MQQRQSNMGDEVQPAPQEASKPEVCLFCLRQMNEVKEEISMFTKLRNCAFVEELYKARNTLKEQLGLPDWRPDDVEKVVVEVLEELLRDQEYDEQQVLAWSDKICETCVRRLVELKRPYNPDHSRATRSRHFALDLLESLLRRRRRGGDVRVAGGASPRPRGARNRKGRKGVSIELLSETPQGQSKREDAPECCSSSFSTAEPSL
ncbi:hypothetical protein Esti_001898 [Eimeria stiedai]